MKKIFAFAFFIIATVASINAQEIKWMSMDEALAAQKKKPKAIFMDVYTDWCGPCKLLDKNTFQTKEVADFINKNYYPVKFNGEGDVSVTYKGKTYTNPKFDPNRKGRNAVHEFTIFLKVQGYPSMIVFDEKGEIKQTIVGYYQPEGLLAELNK